MISAGEARVWRAPAGSHGMTQTSLYRKNGRKGPGSHAAAHDRFVGDELRQVGPERGPGQRSLWTKIGYELGLGGSRGRGPLAPASCSLALDCTRTAWPVRRFAGVDAPSSVKRIAIHTRFLVF